MIVLKHSITEDDIKSVKQLVAYGVKRLSIIDIIDNSSKELLKIAEILRDSKVSCIEFKNDNELSDMRPHMCTKFLLYVLNHVKSLNTLILSMSEIEDADEIIKAISESKLQRLNLIGASSSRKMDGREISRLYEVFAKKYQARSKNLGYHITTVADVIAKNTYLISCNHPALVGVVNRNNNRRRAIAVIGCHTSGYNTTKITTYRDILRIIAKYVLY